MNIFFIRHQNDFEFMLPLILNSPNSFIVIYNDLCNDSKKKIILNKLNFIELKWKNNLISFLYRFLNKLISGKLNYKIKNSYNKYILFQTKRKLVSNIKKIPFRSCSNVIFDHTSDNLSTFLVSYLNNYREEYKLEFKIISAPHGVGAIVNSMCDYHHTKPEFLNGFNVYDKIICNDHQHLNQFIRAGVNQNKLKIINNLRYTKKWVHFLLSENHLDAESSEKINILIVHTKFNGNINSKEVERCLTILSNFDRFNIRIKSHPRGGIKEAQNLAKLFKNINVVTENVVGNVNWSDYVLFFGSSVAYDAFILDKPVLFPSYATSNIVSQDILEKVISLASPDEFYEVVNDIVNGNFINSNVKFSDNYQETLDSWNQLLN